MRINGLAPWILGYAELPFLMVIPASNFAVKANLLAFLLASGIALSVEHNYILRDPMKILKGIGKRDFEDAKLDK